MATTLRPNEIESLKVDYLTGGNSQRELAKKYGISAAYVNKIIKGVHEKEIAAVNAGVAYNGALSELDRKSVNIVEQAVNEKTKHLTFLHNATLKNISVMAKKLNEDATIQDHKTAQDAIHKAGQTLGVIEQFAKSGDVNVQTNTAVQTNNITVEFVD